MTVALVTDSNSQLPSELRQRFAVGVVPLTVVIDGVAYHEGVDITATDFYAHLADGASVSTAAPAPGEVLAVYEAAIDGGATEIVSVHVGANTSGTLNAVSVAAQESSVPVHVVDTGTASFAVACCVWAAGEVLDRGGTAASARDAARRVAERVNNVFVVGAMDLARRGGRLAPAAAADDGVAVLALTGGQMDVVARIRDAEGAVDAMTRYVVDRAAGAPVRVGVGDALAPGLASDFAAALRARPEVADLVHYEIGPSVGAHTGAGTVGACFFTL